MYDYYEKLKTFFSSVKFCNYFYCLVFFFLKGWGETYYSCCKLSSRDVGKGDETARDQGELKI